MKTNDSESTTAVEQKIAKRNPETRAKQNPDLETQFPIFHVGTSLPIDTQRTIASGQSGHTMGGSNTSPRSGHKTVMKLHLNESRGTRFTENNL